MQKHASDLGEDIAVGFHLALIRFRTKFQNEESLSFNGESRRDFFER